MKVDLKSWQTQLKKGAAEVAVLAMLSENEMSGIDILNRLPDFPNIGIAEALKHMRLFWADFEQDLSRLLESKADAKR